MASTQSTKSWASLTCRQPLNEAVRCIQKAFEAESILAHKLSKLDGILVGLQKQEFSI